MTQKTIPFALCCLLLLGCEVNYRASAGASQQPAPAPYVPPPVPYNECAGIPFGRYVLLIDAGEPPPGHLFVVASYGTPGYTFDPDVVLCIARDAFQRNLYCDLGNLPYGDAVEYSVATANSYDAAYYGEPNNLWSTWRGHHTVCLGSETIGYYDQATTVSGPVFNGQLYPSSNSGFFLFETAAYAYGH